MTNILIIDDEKEICESIKMILEYEDYEVDYSTDSSQGLNKLLSGNFDAVLLDIQMPGKNGFEVLQEISQNDILTNVIIISAYGNVENAIKATKYGAFDFIEKPIDRDKLLISVRNAVEQTKLKRENLNLKDSSELSNKIIGESKAVKRIFSVIDTVSRTDARVLITGENGTGKELVARAIHEKSARSKNNFVEVNCAAIPEELIESELFGHIKGAFTGAVQNRMGKFEKAHKGTLFLDEIGDMSLQAQAKALRAIENGTIERVGSEKKIQVDVRIIAATNKDLQKEIKEGRFREDLYHRINVIPIVVPPLRERSEDIPLLVRHFTDLLSLQNNFPKKEFTEDAIAMLRKAEWRGNIRELRNFIERAMILIPDKKISAEAIKDYLPLPSLTDDNLFNIRNSFQEFKEKSEKAFIIKQLEANSWNISKTAEILDIQRSHLYNKMKKYNISKE
ncbi:MAG: sigma-54-dependent Fis family transcriptional regulator [Chlorobi bacterium]|nr:sigma-54-dependent Fis family transcriptional regulator [Chlorobiota bacterium]